MFDRRFESESPGRISAEELERAVRADEEIMVENAVVMGNVNLSSVDYSHRLPLKGCTFRGYFDASEARFNKAVDLSGCTFEQNLSLREARVGGSLRLERAIVQPGSMSITSLELIRIDGHLYAGAMKAQTSITLICGQVTGSASFQGSEIGGDLDMQNVEIGGGLFCRSEGQMQTRIDGTVKMICGKVSRAAFFEGARIGRALNLYHAEIGSGLTCQSQGNFATEIQQVQLSGAKVAGDVSFADARVDTDLFLVNARIDGNVQCSGVEIGRHLSMVNATLEGNVDFRGAQIKQDMNLEGATVRGRLRCGLSDRKKITQVGGNAWLRRAKILGRVNFNGAKIDGNFDIGAGNIGGDFTCNTEEGHSTEIGGKMWLGGVNVANHQLQFCGTRVQDCLVLQHAVIQGAFFCPWEHRPERNAACGADQLASIGTKVDLTSSKIGTLVMDGTLCQDGELDLCVAQINEFEIRGSLPTNVNAEGFQFQRISLPKQSFRGFLARTEPFQKSTYVFFEQWLRSRGNRRKANQVYRDMRYKDRREGLGIGSRLGDCFLSVTIGYGTRSYPLLIFFLLTMALSVSLFSSPRSVERVVVMTAQETMYPSVETRPSVFPQNWCLTDAFWVAVRVNLPMLSFATDSRWEPSGEPILLPSFEINDYQVQFVSTYRTYALIVSMLSWIIVPLFLIGISGVVKRE